ncbi:hypothetical protein [Nonomuraea sp. NPDC050202]|uniref:hypothetical protein n=1 Tax=Nonomuraea sp. NPDC050202 TaxID=3155035 RepID=UPI0034002588
MANHVTTTRTSELSGEPALVAATVAAGLQLVTAFWIPLPEAAVAGINAVVLAAAGVWMAVATRATDNGGSIKAAVLGLLQAGVSLAVTFGWDASPSQTATLMTFVGLLLGLFVRQTSIPASAAEPKPGRGVHAGRDFDSL